MSILVITTMTGTFNARAIPRCSLNIRLAPQLGDLEQYPYLLMPISPLFAATINKQ